VRFPDSRYDETWAAVEVARHIGSSHEVLDVNAGEGTWDRVTGLLRQAGQPFADTSLFAVSAVCKLMRQHVAVALSGDGGDEGFGGYDTFWRAGRIAPLLQLPAPLWRGAAAVLRPFARMGAVRSWAPDRVLELTAADDTSLIQSFYSMPAADHGALCIDTDLLPVRRLFEPRWANIFPRGASRLERLSAGLTETDMRLVLPNDFLFKVDTASMKESLEVRVPMLDEDLVEFGLTLPHRLKVKGRVCKRVLRDVAARRLPALVANKPKMGFAIPVDVWVNGAFKQRIRETLLGKSSRLPDVFRPEVYKPWIESFCSGGSSFGLSRQGLYNRAIMLLAVQMAFGGAEN
jgi:asparagine synthase (glutamine-hydrolysing)